MDSNEKRRIRKLSSLILAVLLGGWSLLQMLDYQANPTFCLTYSNFTDTIEDCGNLSYLKEKHPDLFKERNNNIYVVPDSYHINLTFNNSRP